MLADDIDYTINFPTLFVALDWIPRHCVIPDRFRAGQPFELLDWQFWCMANAYRIKPGALWVPEDPILAPSFYWRRSLIVMPQKAGKAPYTAARICVEAVGPAVFAGWATGGERYRCADHRCGCGWEYEYQPGEAMGMPWPTPLIQVTATSEAQTRNIWRMLRPMIDRGPLAEVIPKTGTKAIALPGGGEINQVTASATGRLGQQTTYVAQDETGLYTEGNNMKGIADTQRRNTSAMGGRVEETSNGWDPSKDSTAQNTAENDDTDDVFVFHPEAPEALDYEDAAQRRQIHECVYLESIRTRGGHVDLDSIDAEAAELAAKDPFQAERFFGNRIKTGGSPWLKAGLWAARRVDRAVPLGSTVCGGFDGSDSDDWTAIRLCTPDGHLFTPRWGPLEEPTYWNPAKTGGEIPRDEVLLAFGWIFDNYKVLRFYCDPREWKTEISGLATEHGERRIYKWDTNRPVQMCDALRRFTTDLRHRVTHDGCKQTALHVGNARRKATTGDRYKLIKASPVQKIDLGMASVLAYEAACDAVAAKEIGPTRRRRAVVLS